MRLPTAAWFFGEPAALAPAAENDREDDDDGYDGDDAASDGECAR